MATTVTVRSIAGERYTQEIQSGEHYLIADEPTDLGGSNRGPGPYEYLLAGLGACIAMTLRMYADRKGLPLEGVGVVLGHERIHAKDCEDCETKEGMLSEVHVEVALQGDLDSAQRKRLLEIAQMCPVHRTLVGEVKVRTRAAG